MTRAMVILLVLRCCCNSLVERHRAARCEAPGGWYVNGARGHSYELRPVLGRSQDDLLDAWLRKELEGPAPVRGELYCTNGMTLRQDGLSVWCARP